MTVFLKRFNALFSLLLFLSLCLGMFVPTAHASDLVPSDDLTGGASVFVFRSSRKAPQERGAVKTFRSRGAAGTARRANVRSQIAIQRKKRADSAKARAAAAARQRAKARTARLRLSNTLTARAETQLEQGQFAGASVNFREALKANPRNEDAKRGLSETLTAIGIDTAGETDNEAALEYFDEAVKLDPTNASAFAKIGEIHDAKGREKEAVINYQKALTLDPEFTSLYLPIGLAYSQQGSIVEALTYLNKAEAAGFSSPEAKLARIAIMIRQDRDKDALDAVNALLQNDPQNAAAFYQRGNLYAKLNQPENSVAAYKDAVRVDATFVPAWFDLGVNYYNRENYPLALDAYEHVVKLEPNNYQAQANLASTYRQLERFSEANAAYKAAEPGNKENPELYSEWGYCLGKTNEWDKSIARLNTARELSPTAVDNNNTGWAYYNSARHDLQANKDADVKVKLTLGKAYLEKAVQEDPKMDAAYLNLGATNNSLGDFKGAVAALNHALSVKSDWVIALNQLGLAYRGSNDLANALLQFQRVSALDANNAFGLYNLGEVYHLTGNKKEAKRIQDRLKRINPSLAQNLDAFFDGKAVLNDAKRKIQNKIRIPKFPY